MPTGRTRILLLVPSFVGGAGGAERVISILLHHLDRNLFELHVALGQGRHSHFENLPDDVYIHALQVSRMRYALPAIIKIVWKVRPKTILATVSYLNAMLILAKPFLPRNTKLVLREAVIPSAFITQEARHPRFWQWAYRHLYGKADRIICLSDSMVQDFERRFMISSEKLVRIYNPVDFAAIRELADTGTDPYSAKRPRLLATGRLQKQKGFDILLRAMPLILNELPDANLTIVGEGPLDAELRAQVQKLGLMQEVKFTGFQPNPWLYMKHADLFVLPSRFEGLPNALLEALALEKPAIASDCPGGVREIQGSFPNLTLVPPDSPDALAEAVLRLCRHLNRDPIAPTKECRSRFDLQIAVRSYTDILL